MTTEQTATPAVEQPQDAPDTAEEPTAAPEDAQSPPEPHEDDQDPHDGEDGGKAAREARKYRQRLRAAESELEAANARIETLQRAEVERIAKGMDIRRPSGIWAGGLALDQVRDEHGNIDPETARQRIGAIRDEIGLAQEINRQPDPAQTAIYEPGPGSEWTDAFRF